MSASRSTPPPSGNPLLPGPAKLTFRLLVAALAWAAAAGCHSSAGAPAGQSAEPVQHPIPESILFVSLDTLRADMLGVYGYEEYPTSPTLDRFAAEGVLFENAIVQEPRTLTSHASLFTGLYPQHHGVEEEVALDRRIPTLASMLRDLGYRTQAFVDDGYLDRHWGFDQGFDGYVGDRRRGFAEILPEAVAWLREHGDERFFLFLHTYDTHSVGDSPFYRAPKPFSGTFSTGIDSALRSSSKVEFEKKWAEHRAAPTEADKRFIRATYAEAVRYVDERMAELFAFLRDQGLYERLLIVVWSDHGEGLLSHVSWLHDELFDHTIRVPLLVKLPHGQHAGTRIRTPVSSVDLLPTILELAGKPGVALDGHSLLPLLSRDDGEGVAYSRRTKNGQRLFSIRNRRFHLIRDDASGRESFYDLATDPDQRENLSPSGTPTEELLRRQLRAWVAEHDRALAEQRREKLGLDAETAEHLRALGYLQ